MKKRNLFITLGLAMGLGLGVAAGLGTKQEVKKADAAGEIRVYFDANNCSGFFGGGCTLRVYYWGGTSSATWSGVQMTQTINQYGRDIYYYDVPSGTKGLVFGQYAKDAASNADPNVRWEISDTSEYGPDDGYNFFQPNSNWKANEYSTFKAYTATLHVDATTSTELAVDWAAYNPANPSVSGKEFVNWCTNSTFTSDYTPATPSANVELWAKFANSARIVFKDSSTGDNLALSPTEWSVTYAFAANDEFKIVKTLSGGATVDYCTLQDGLSEIATSDGSYIKIKAAGTYSLYLKLPSDGENPNKIYIMTATPSSEAYSYADYFLANVGCALPDEPTGWALCEARYAKVSTEGRNEIAKYSPDEDGNKIEEMLACYRYARANHNSLSNFLVNGSGVAILSSVRVPATSLPEQQVNNTTLIIVITVSAVALIGVASYFLLRRRKED